MAKFVHLGRRPYKEVWDLQKEYQKALIAGESDEVVLFVEHDPEVITLGKSTKRENLLLSIDELGAKGVEVFEIERGGDVTWHGPGQLVVYPILNLNNHKRDVHWYMRSLEEIIISSLKVFDIEGLRSKGNTGVWVEATENIEVFPLLKIASLGVRISRWVTLHGFSINIFDKMNHEGPKAINPCGFNSSLMTSVEQEMKRRGLKHELTMSKFEEITEKMFLNVFYPDA